MSTHLLNPVIIAQLGNLHLRARRILEGLYSGHHINRNKGSSQNFSEHRPYNPGDDLRGLDWKVFGRTDRLVIKQYEEQTNVTATIIIDDSASMQYSKDGRPSKLDYAKTLAAAMGYLMVSQHDAVGLITRFRRLPPSHSRLHLDRLMHELEGISAQGVWNISRLADNVETPLKRRGFVMVFSDLLEDTDQVVSTLRALHTRKYEVMVFQIFDPAERDFPFEGPTVFEDIETGERIRTDSDAIRVAYKRVVEKKLAHLAHMFQSSGLDYLFLTTDTPFEKGLGAYLARRGIHL